MLEQAETQQQNLVAYQQAFIEVVEREFPLSKSTCRELSQLWQSLNLSQEVVRQIERPIVNQKAKEYEQRRAQELEERRQESQTSTPSPTIDREKIIDEILEQDSESIPESITSSESSDRPKAISVAEPKYIELTQDGEKFAGLPLSTVEFETVTVNTQGEEDSRSTHQAKLFKEDLGNGITLEMVSIPGGEFLMGSPQDEGNSNEPEFGLSRLR